MDALGLVLWKWWGFPELFALTRGGGSESPTQTYDWVLTVINGESDYGTIDEGEVLTLTIESGYGYVPPTEITVTVGGSVLTTTDYDYDSTTGVVSIHSGVIDNDVSITATCPMATWEQAKTNGVTWEQAKTEGLEWN